VISDGAICRGRVPMDLAGSTALDSSSSAVKKVTITEANVPRLYSLLKMSTFVF